MKNDLIIIIMDVNKNVFPQTIGEQFLTHEKKKATID